MEGKYKLRDGDKGKVAGLEGPKEMKRGESLRAKNRVG